MFYQIKLKTIPRFIDDVLEINYQSCCKVVAFFLGHPVCNKMPHVERYNSPPVFIRRIYLYTRRWDAMVEFDQTWFIFQYSPLRSTHFSIGVLNCWIWPHRSATASQPSVFHVGEQKIIRWCQISHAQRPLQPQNCVQGHCETGLLRQFSRPFTKCF